ncbi:NAD(P)H-dependent oxidoreductase [Nocardia transvalensis]|uniref:NAD(P)H-dependent oxidoreductase n=1 Tax=Nocardia transvalensis TaxID=37333 RepID=UPI00189597B7|nr:NAD(P)H-dependent oxidoreductase [Nocardia transvalensis]MBF6328416.1 NAD(P)H-dependent oxidoreductase [Nocardia transvalensis]
MTSSGSILWIFAHPDPDSLSHSLYRHGVEHLRRSGHQVTAVDLYAERWNPILSDDDTAGATGATLSDRQRHATREHQTCRSGTDHDHLGGHEITPVPSHCDSSAAPPSVSFI